MARVQAAVALQVERNFSNLKHLRRIASRYDKLGDNFLAMVRLAPLRLWLRAYETTATSKSGSSR